MFKDELKNFVETNPDLVQRKSIKDGMSILKYKKRVFFDSLWNDFLEDCRGTIIDEDFNVVSLPFRKIYNFGVEDRAPLIKSDEIVTAYQKMNGFMVAVSVHKGELLVSTTGSIDSEFVAMANEELAKINLGAIKEFARDEKVTVLFECCHRNDPHIIPEKEGLYLLGWRKNKWESNMAHMASKNTAVFVNQVAEQFGCHPVNHVVTTMGELQAMMKLVKHEGFVIYATGGRVTKMKSKYYLVKKFFARCGKMTKITDVNVKEKIDEEYYPLVDFIQENIVEYEALDEQARLSYIRTFLEK